MIPPIIRQSYRNKISPILSYKDKIQNDKTLRITIPCNSNLVESIKYFMTLVENFSSKNSSQPNKIIHADDDIVCLLLTFSNYITLLIQLMRKSYGMVLKDFHIQSFHLFL